VDGDTIKLDGDRIRLLQINTPEVGQCYYQEAKDFTASMVRGGQRIELKADPNLDQTDTYGRSLRYVFVDGLNLNVELVRRGYAKPLFFNNRRGKYSELITKYAGQAKTKRLGLWKC
jgi:micrococcal nuclease